MIYVTKRAYKIMGIIAIGIIICLFLGLLFHKFMISPMGTWHIDMDKTLRGITSISRDYRKNNNNPSLPAYKKHFITKYTGMKITFTKAKYAKWGKYSHGDLPRVNLTPSFEGSAEYYGWEKEKLGVISLRNQPGRSVPDTFEWGSFINGYFSATLETDDGIIHFRR